MNEPGDFTYRGPKFKVGDLVRSRHYGYLGLVLAVLNNGWKIQIQWIDTLKIDEGGATTFEIIQCL